MQPNPLRGVYLVGFITLVLLVFTFILLLLQFFGIQGKRFVVTAGNDVGFLDKFEGSVTGKATEIKDGMLTIENKRGQKKQYKASSALLVPELNEQSVVAPTTDLGKIDKSKEYTFNLLLNEGQLEVFSMMIVLAPGQLKQSPPVNISATTPVSTGAATRVTPQPVVPAETKPPAATPEP